MIQLAIVLLVSATAAAAVPRWPPPMPPMLPSQFFAEVTGFQTGEAGNVVFFNESGRGSKVTLEGVWHYDFPRNRMRADYAEFVNGTFLRDLTELWWANGEPGTAGRMAVFVFQRGKQCVKYDISAMFPGTNSIVRPDGFIRSNATHVERKISPDKPSVWVDHWSTGPPDDRFELDSDINSLLPVKDYGTGGPNANAANVFQTIAPGPQDPSQFETLLANSSKCIAVQPAPPEASAGMDSSTGSWARVAQAFPGMPQHAAFWLRRAI